MCNMSCSIIFFYLRSWQLIAAIAVTTLLFVPKITNALTFNVTALNNNNNNNNIVNCYGDAILSSKGIDLTLNQRDQNINYSTGRAVYHEPLHLWDKISGEAANFTTHFTFIIRNQTADGLAFFMAPFPAVHIPNNSGGGDFGLFNGSTTQIVAVEFDTYRNPFDPLAFHPYDTHIGIDVNSALSITYVILENASLVTNYAGHATISYNASNTTLSVWLTYPDNPSLVGRSWNVSYEFDLRIVLPEQVAIGFSAATGASIELHTIKSWDFFSTELMQIIPPAPAPVKERTVTKWPILQVVVLLVILGFVLFVVWCCWKRRLKKNDDHLQDHDSRNIDGIFHQSDSAPKRFGYDELANATRNFSVDEKLGEGGFGAVYRGVLVSMNDMQVAIKRISKGSMQGMKEYMTEVTIISQLKHRYLVQLIGYCHERGEFLLVYEYLPNKSLDMHLYNRHTLVGSEERYKIALDIASTLMYLHEGWEQGVVHRDIKPSNIMLDSNFNAKLGDFGMAKLVGHDKTMLTTILAGTKGYMAPEYMETGKAGKECDVYSFGILAMELACGRKPIDHLEQEGRVKLVDWVWELYEKQMCHEAIDKRFNKELDNGRMEHLMVVGLWCAHSDYRMRPTIRQAFCVLNFDAKLPPTPTRKNYDSLIGRTSSSPIGVSLQ